MFLLSRNSTFLGDDSLPQARSMQSLDQSTGTSGEGYKKYSSSHWSTENEVVVWVSALARKSTELNKCEGPRSSFFHMMLANRRLGRSTWGKMVKRMNLAVR